MYPLLEKPVSDPVMPAPSAFISRKPRPFSYPYPAPPSRVLSLLNASGNQQLRHVTHV